MWFCFFDLETSLAAEFWILCSFVKSLSRDTVQETVAIVQKGMLQMHGQESQLWPCLETSESCRYA